MHYLIKRARQLMLDARVARYRRHRTYSVTEARARRWFAVRAEYRLMEYGR